jgi:hypothetical protein
MILACFMLGLAQAKPDFNSSELKVQALLKDKGGSLEWVAPDSPDSKEPWVLSLDITNKDREFDCASIAPLKRLYALRIFGGTVTHNSLNVLATLPRLGLLVITGSVISNEGLKSIGRCKSINKLDVGGSSINADGLTALKGMKSLRRVFLYNTEVKDADLKPLEAMSFLQQLVLPKTVSEEASRALAAKLPSTRISRL